MKESHDETLVDRICSLEAKVRNLSIVSAELQLKFRVHAFALGTLALMLNDHPNVHVAADTFRESVNAICASVDKNPALPPYQAVVHTEAEAFLEALEQPHMATKTPENTDEDTSRDSKQMLLYTMMAAVKALFENHPNPRGLQALWSNHIETLEAIATDAPRSAAVSIGWAKSLLRDGLAADEIPPLLH